MAGYSLDEAQNWHANSLTSDYLEAYNQTSDLLNGEICLDLNCGTGVFLAMLAKQGMIAVGTDASINSLNKAIEYLKDNDIKAEIIYDPINLNLNHNAKGTVQLIHCNITDIQKSCLPLNTFDNIICTFPLLTDLNEQHYKNIIHAIPDVLPSMAIDRKTRQQAIKIFRNNHSLPKNHFTLVDDGTGPMPNQNIMKSLVMLLGDARLAGKVYNNALRSGIHQFIFQKAYPFLAPEGRFITAVYFGNNYNKDLQLINEIGEIYAITYFGDINSTYFPYKHGPRKLIDTDISDNQSGDTSNVLVISADKGG